MCSVKEKDNNLKNKKGVNEIEELKEKEKKLLYEIEELKEKEKKLLYVISEERNQKTFNENLNKAITKRTIEKLIKKFLTILDSLEIAARYSSDVGLKMILKQLEEVFKEEGLKKIEIVPLKDKYDVKFHKVTKIEKNPSYLDKVILKVEKEGYFFKESILREAEVTVNKTES